MSDDVVIKVQNLSKKYTLHHLQPKAQGLRHVLEDTISGPWRALRESWRNSRSRKQNSENQNSEAPDSAFRPSLSALADEDFWALKDVSFEVKRGEVLGIIGRNGAGKSTLLKILSRITEPTTGRIEIEGRVASLLEVGTGFHQELTGRENVFLNGAILGMTRAEIRRKFDEIVAFSGVEQFLDTPVKRYSTGMHVRLAFAVAAHLEPEILIVDEVLAVGDSDFQQKCLGKMETIAGSGRTVILVSHNMASIESLCSRVVCLRSGTVAEDGIPSVAIDAYMQAINTGIEPVKNPTKRSGDGTVHITAIDMFTGSENTRTAKTGEDIRIRFHYASKQQCANADLAFGFYNSRGQRIAWLNSEISGNRLGTIALKGTIECRIPRLPLMPDRYSINVQFSVDGRVADHLEDAITLTVIDGDFYGTGKLPVWGVVALDQEWSAREGDGTSASR